MTSVLPEHVPEELVTPHDIYAVPGGDVDPQVAWKSFQGHGPIVWSPLHGGFWIVTNGPDVSKFYRDADLLSSAKIQVPPLDGMPLLPVQADGDAHKQYRKTIESYFSAKNIADLEPHLRQDAIDLIDTIAAKNETDFVSDFARVYPLSVILRLIGLPLGDREYLYGLVQQIALQSDVDLRMAAFGELAGYLSKWIEQRIAEPADDAISHIAKATIDGRPYTREEMLGTVVLMCTAGLDTTTATMGFIMLHLARHPEDRQFIRENPRKRLRAINELLRRYAVTSLARVARRDFDYGGVTVRKGDMVYLPIQLFNLDESLFPDPHKVDFSRPPKHISFGNGPHSCVGANLARSELSILLEEWLERIPDFQLKDDDSVALRASQNCLVDKLVLTW
jgi:cytochrome P450